VCDSAGMSIFDDLGAEQERLEKILSGLDEAQWRSASAAEGWTIADVVLHLAQSEEAAAATVTHGTLRAGLGAVAGDTMDARADAAVRMERAVLPSGPAEVFARWQRARRAALAAMRAADPDQPVPWMVGTLKPATLATTRLAEHWAHGLDIAGATDISDISEAVGPDVHFVRVDGIHLDPKHGHKVFDLDRDAVAKLMQLNKKSTIPDATLQGMIDSLLQADRILAENALADADVPPATADAIVDENAEARIDGLRAALAVLALIAVVALFATWRLPTKQPDATEASGAAAPTS